MEGKTKQNKDQKNPNLDKAKELKFSKLLLITYNRSVFYIILYKISVIFFHLKMCQFQN